MENMRSVMMHQDAVIVVAVRKVAADARALFQHKNAHACTLRELSRDHAACKPCPHDDCIEIARTDLKITAVANGHRAQPPLVRRTAMRTAARTPPTSSSIYTE